MPDSEIAIKFSADDSEVEAQMQNVNGLLTDLIDASARANEELKNLEAGAGSASSRVLEMRARLNSLNEQSPVAQDWSARMSQFSTLDQRVDYFASAFGKLEEQAGELAEQFERGELSLDGYEQALQKLARGATANTSGIARLKAEVAAANTLLSGDGHIGAAADLYARLTERVNEAGSRVEGLVMTFAREAETLRAQAAAADSSTVAGAKQAAAWTKAAEQAEKYADRGRQLTRQLTDLSAKIDTVGAGFGKGKDSYARAGEELEKYASRVDALSERTEAMARHEQNLGAVRENVAQKSAAAAAAEEAAEQKTAASMQYGAMTRRQLIAATRELIEQRQKAAAAGDAQAVQNYSMRLSAARSQLRAMNQELSLSRIQLMQQAQMGMQAALSLQNIGQQAASGSPDVASMANSMLSLGMAMKAGLGPVGAVMAAVQGLSAAMQWLNKTTEENKQKAAEARKTQQDLTLSLRAANRAQADEARKAYYQQELSSIQEVIKARARMAEEKKEENDASAQQRLQQSKQAIEEQRKLEQEQFARLASLAQTRLALGDRSAQQEAQQETRRHEQKMRNLELEQAQADVTFAEDKLRNAREQARLLREAADTKFDKALSFDTSGMQRELERLENVIGRMTGKADLDHTREQAVAQRNAILDAAQPIVDALQAIDPNLRLGGREAIAFVESLRKSRQSAQEMAGRLESLKIPELENNLAAAGQNYEKVKQQTARVALAMQAQAVQLEGSYRQDDTRTQQEIARADLQRLNAKKQQLTAALASLAADSQGAALVRASLATLQTQIRAVRDTGARNAREKGWQEAQAGTLREQRGYLERMLASTREGSKEWERWAQESNSLAGKELERIRRMSDGVSEDSGSAARRSLLRLQQQQLSQLAERTGLSAATAAAITQELAAVQRNAASWRAAMQKNAAEGQKKLLTAQAPQAAPVNKNTGGNLSLLGKSWEKTARAMETAARNGNDAQLSRLVDHLRRNAKTSERLTGDTGKYAAAFQQLVKAAAALRLSGDGLTQKQRARKETDRQLADPLERRRQRELELQERQLRRSPRSRLAAGAEEPADARRGQRPAAAANRPAAAGAAQGAAAGGMQQQPNADLSPAQKAAEQTAQAVQQINEQARQLGSTLQGVASAASQAAASFEQLQRTVQQIQSELSRIRARL